MTFKLTAGSDYHACGVKRVPTEHRCDVGGLHVVMCECGAVEQARSFITSYSQPRRNECFGLSAV